MRCGYVLLLALLVTCPAGGQTALTWEQVKSRFQTANPTLRAAQLNVQESKAQEVTAYLRPNPNVTLLMDQLDPFSGNPYRPFTNSLPLISMDYLHERQHKRELRLESAQQGTAIAQSQAADTERTMIFNLRTAFVQTLQAKALLVSAQENLDYFDKQLSINQDRYRAGDIARVDLDRVLLQRVQYQSDFESAQVNLRTAKITLLTLLNDRTPLDRFDVTGNYDFSPGVQPLSAFRETALANRPDLQAAIQTIRKADVDHRLAVANGSTDPTIAVDFGRNPPIPVYMGVSVSIPVRIFDRNQGEKARTQIDIEHAERTRQATEAQVFSDVDSAYYALLSALNLLKPYREPDGYLATAGRIRDTISFSYQHGQAALVDYLDAQREYRATQVAYINLIASYLTTAGQLNLAVGREVIP